MRKRNDLDHDPSNRDCWPSGKAPRRPGAARLSRPPIVRTAGRSVNRASRLLLALSCVAATGILQAASEDGCASLELHGYQVGMTRAAAQAVRGGRAASSGALRVKEAGRFKGRLEFDDRGLRRYEAVMQGDATAGALRLALVDRFGPPSEEMDDDRWHPIAGTIAARSSVWFFDACDTLLALVDLSAGGSIRVSSPHLVLRRLSDWREQQGALLD